MASAGGLTDWGNYKAQLAVLEKVVAAASVTVDLMGVQHYPNALTPCFSRNLWLMHYVSPYQAGTCPYPVHFHNACQATIISTAPPKMTAEGHQGLQRP